MALFVRKSELSKYPFAELKELQDHGSFRLGVTLDYFYGPQMDDWIKQNKDSKRILVVNQDGKHYKLLTNR